MPPPTDRAPLTKSDAPSTHPAGGNAPTSKEVRLPGHELTNEDVAWDLFDSFEESIEQIPSIYAFSPEKIFTGVVEPSADDAVCQWQVSDRTRLGNCIAKAFRLPPDYIENITSTAVPWMLNTGERQLRWVLEIKLKPSKEVLANRVINNDVIETHEASLGVKQHRLPGGGSQAFQGVKLLSYKTTLLTQESKEKGINVYITTARHLPNIRGIPGVFVDPENETSNVFEGTMYNFDTGKICLSNMLHREKIMALFQALFDAHYDLDPVGSPRPKVLRMGVSYKNASAGWEVPEIVPTGLVYITVGFDRAPSSLFNYIPFPKNGSSRIKWRHKDPPKCEYKQPDVPLPKTPPKGGKKGGTHRGKKNPNAPSVVAKRASHAEGKRPASKQGDSEKPLPTKPCREFNLGTCRFGERCTFLHELVDRDNFICHKARCNHAKCSFLHEVSSKSRGRGKGGKGKGQASSSSDQGRGAASGTGVWPGSRPSLKAAEAGAKRGRWGERSESEEDEEAASQAGTLDGTDVGSLVDEDGEVLDSEAPLALDEPMPESTQMPDDESSQNLLTLTEEF